MRPIRWTTWRRLELKLYEKVLCPIEKADRQGYGNKGSATFLVNFHPMPEEDHEVKSLIRCEENNRPGR
ncbi:MAG: hypothetical protein ABFD97_20520 [Syntrophobacter sp.]